MGNQVFELGKDQIIEYNDSRCNQGFYSDFEAWQALIHALGYANCDNVPFSIMIDSFISIINTEILKCQEHQMIGFRSFIEIILMNLKSDEKYRKRYIELSKEIRNYFKANTKYRQVFENVLKAIESDDSIPEFQKTLVGIAL